MRVRALVPRNRWDLLPDATPEDVAVVVTHYEQHAQLRRVLDALASQTLRPAEVVVADDGSARAPDVPAGVRVVRQEDLGFRAAAARNLGAAATRSGTLAFLDADTVPEPAYLERLVRRVAASDDVLAVGRRRHAGAAGELPEPAWLRDGYAASRELLDADGLSFRYVISAVLACSRSLFEDVGGFDERFVGYGGEDWDLGYRAWNNGALLVHEPTAVAWHDGPDWAGRGGGTAVKDEETRRLAALVPHPQVRGAPLPQRLPDVLVDLDRYDARTVTALLRQEHRDLAVRCPDPAPLHADVVRAEPWDVDQHRRARVRLQLTAGTLLAPGAVGDLVALLTEEDLGEVLLVAGGLRVGVARSTRADGRSRRHGRDVAAEAFGSVEREVALVPPKGDLAGFLAGPWQVPNLP